MPLRIYIYLISTTSLDRNEYCNYTVVVIAVSSYMRDTVMKRAIVILAKFTLTCMGTLFGMVSGAVVIYFLFGIFYLSVIGVNTDPRMASEECARGSALGYLSIIGGGLLGAAIGCYAVLNSMKLIKAGSDRSN